MPNDVSARRTASFVRRGLGEDPISLRYGRGQPRAFYVVPQPEHKNLLVERIERIMAGPWRKHFERVV